MKTSRLLVFLMMVLAVGLLASCDDDSSGPDNQPCTNLDELLDLAYQSLEDTMADLTDPDAEGPQDPSDVDLSATRALYQDAYDCDKTSSEARAGLAFADMMSMTQDSDVNRVYDDWSTYLDGSMPFEVPDKMMLVRVGMASLMNRSLTEVSVGIAKMALANRDKSVKVGDAPQIGDVQDILWNDVLPKVKAAKALLTSAAADEDFSFIITGRMMGDELADDVEIDQTDAQVILAGVRMIEAVIYILTAYDFDMDSYDDAGILAAFNQDTGSMLTLKAGAGANLALVPGLFQAAIDDLTDAINSLLAETDVQDNDAITLDLLDLDEADLVELRDDILPDVRAAMNSGGFEIEQDWDSDDTTPDQSLTVDLNAFFNNPIADWKKIFPDYTLTVDEVPCGTEDYYEYGFSRTVSLDVPGSYTDSYSYINIEVNHFDEIESDDYNEYFDAYETACLDILDDVLADLNDLPNWSGWAYVSFSVYGLTAGTTVSTSISWDYDYETTDTFVYAPLVTWDAADGTAWFNAIPNPDLNGLLPDFDSGSDYLDFFDIDPSGFPQEFLLDWGDVCGGDIGIGDFKSHKSGAAR